MGKTRKEERIELRTAKLLLMSAIIGSIGSILTLAAAIIALISLR